MSLYTIRTRAGIALWTGAAHSVLGALHAMARQAGYRDAGDLPAEVRGWGLNVDPLKA